MGKTEAVLFNKVLKSDVNLYVIYKFHSASQETRCISMTHTGEMGEKCPSICVMSFKTKACIYNNTLNRQTLSFVDIFWLTLYITKINSDGKMVCNS